MKTVRWNDAAAAFRDMDTGGRKTAVAHIIADGTLRDCVQELAGMTPAELAGVYIEVSDTPWQRFDAPEVGRLIGLL